MAKKLLFSERIKQVRESYALSQKQISLLIPTISKTTIVYWESGDRTPTLDNLTAFASTFGISLNWLAGLTEYPYDNELLINIENSLLRTTKNNKFFNNVIKFPQDYLNVEKRIMLYPNLSVRANILFLCNYYLSCWSNLNNKVDLQNTLLSKLKRKIIPTELPDFGKDLFVIQHKLQTLLNDKTKAVPQYVIKTPNVR